MEETTITSEIIDLVEVHRREIKKSYPFRSPLNSPAFPKDHEVNTQPSKTIPDQSLSVREIMERYARGLPLDGQRVPIYNGETDELEGLDINKLDLSEKHELVEQNKQRIQQMQSDLQNKGKKKPLKQLDIPLPPQPNEGNSAAPSAAQAAQQKEPK